MRLDPIPPTIETADLPEPGAAQRALFAELRELLVGQWEAWPCSTDDVVERAMVLGYDIDRRGVHYLLRNKRTDRTPEKRGGELVWSVNDAAGLMAALDAQRWYLPGSPHAAKLTARERDDAAQRLRERREELRPLLDRFSGRPMRELVRALADDDAPTREGAWRLALGRALALGWPLSPAVRRFAIEAIGTDDADLRREGAAAVERVLEGLVGADALDAPYPPAPRPVVTVAQMLVSLRSGDPQERFAAGAMLAQSIGAGLRLQGLGVEDAEHGAGRTLSTMIARAMQGDRVAVDALSAALTTDLSHAAGVPAEAPSAPIAEPTAEARVLAERQSPDELLDTIEADDARRSTLVEALFVAVGERSTPESRRHVGALLRLAEGLAAGEADAIERARAWVGAYIIAGATPADGNVS